MEEGKLPAAGNYWVTRHKWEQGRLCAWDLGILLNAEHPIFIHANMLVWWAIINSYFPIHLSVFIHYIFIPIQFKLGIEAFFQFSSNFALLLFVSFSTRLESNCYKTLTSQPIFEFCVGFYSRTDVFWNNPFLAEPQSWTFGCLKMNI
jgi:hypothetical protein